MQRRDSEGGTRRFHRLDVAAVLLLMAAVAGGGALRMVPGVCGAFHDDAIYAITAKALADGEGYRLTNLPGAPRQINYPILFPALLAPLWRLTDSPTAAITAMQAVTVAIAAIAVGLAYLFLVRFAFAGRAPAFAAGLLCASAPNFLYYSSAIMSEMPFALALVAALWAAESGFRHDRSDARRELLIGIALGVPFLCRFVGVVVAPAVVLAAVVHRRRIRWIVAGAALVTLPWLAWTVSGMGRAAPGSSRTMWTDYLSWWQWVGLGWAFDIGMANVVKACAAVMHITFDGPARALYAAVEWAHSAVVLAGAAVWIAVATRLRRVSALALTLAVYAGVLFFWPWPPDRFIVPLLPLVLAIAFDVILAAIQRALPARAAVATLALAIAAVVTSNLALLQRFVETSRRAQYPYFQLPSDGKEVRWSEFEAAFAWLRAHSDSGDVLSAGFDTMVALYTGRPTIRAYAQRPRALYYGDDAPPVGTPADLARLLDEHRPRYLVVSPLPSFADEEPFYELMTGFLRDYPGRLRLAYQGADPRFAIFALAESGPR